MIALLQEHNILHGFTESLTRRKIQKCRQKLGNGHDVEIHLTVADLYTHLGDDSLALQAYQTAIHSLITHGTPLTRDDSEQLISICKHLLSLSPCNEDVLRILSQEYLRRGLTYRAVELHSSAADRYAQSGNYRKAIAHYQNVFAIEPGSITTRVRCAALLCQLRQYTEAAQQYERIGDLYSEHQRFDGALEYYQQAAHLHPHNEKVTQKIDMTRNILNGRPIPRRQPDRQTCKTGTHDYGHLQRSLEEKTRREHTLRQNIQHVKRQYRQMLAQKNTKLRLTQTRLEELSTYVAVLKDTLEQVEGEKHTLGQQLKQAFLQKQGLTQKLKRLQTVRLTQQAQQGDNDGSPPPECAKIHTARLQSADRKLAEEKHRLEARLHTKIARVSKHEEQLRAHLHVQTSRRNDVRQQLRQTMQEYDDIQGRLHAHLQQTKKRESLLQEHIQELLAQHEQALLHITQEKRRLQERYYSTREAMNRAETDTMATLEQLRGELSRQWDFEANFSEQFHESLQEIAMLLHTQEQEIQELECL